MAQNVEHASPGIKLSPLEGLLARRLALGAVVLRKAPVHDAPVAVELPCDVPSGNGNGASSNKYR